MVYNLLQLHGVSHYINGLPYSIIGWLPLTFYERASSVVRIWDLESKREILSCPGALSGVFSPDGSLLATDDGESIQIWDLPPGRPWGLILKFASMAWMVMLALLIAAWLGLRFLKEMRIRFS
jgi:WD40 repeat protein